MGRLRIAAALMVCGAASASCAAILGFEDGTLGADGGAIGTRSEGGPDGPGAPGADSGSDAALDGALSTDALAGGDAADAALDAAGDDAGTKQAFETPLTFNGRLDANGVAGSGGLAAGDARCHEAALAKFPGRTFVAWLSTSTKSAASRLAGAGPWYVGATYLGGLTELTTGSLMTPLDKTPDGAAIVAPAGVWTGTEGDGTANAAICTDWTTISSGISAEIGSSGVSGTFWTYGTLRTCDSTYHLYCFEK
jgi:hypothetical protein